MNPVNEYIRRVFCIQPKIPEEIQIEITNLCNLDCKMCPRKKLPIKYKQMELDFFKDVIKRLDGVKEIILTGWGEPTVHKDLAEMVSIVKKSGKKARLTTNGLLINEKLARKLIDAGIDSITFSVDYVDSKEENEFGHTNKKSLENIRRLAKLEDRPSIVIQSILEKPTSNILRICDFAKEVGAERLNISRVFTFFSEGMPRPSHEEEKMMIKEIFSYAKKIGLQADMIQYGVGKGLTRFFYPIGKHAMGLFGKNCLRLFNYAYINVDGNITPCCLLPSLSVGNIMEKSLEEIWQGDELKRFIANHNKHPVCKKCDLWRIKYFD